MIPIDFDYYRPDTLKEAAEVYQNLSANGVPLYLCGGSEIITMSRVGSIAPTSVIDIKAIPECTVLEFLGDKLVIGSAVSLTQVSESGHFPLLGTTVARIADHTNQYRITVGGNVCGTIYYRESVLPLLLTDCDVVLCGKNGMKTVPINELFCERIRLEPGDFVVQFLVRKAYLDLPYFHAKKTKSEKIDYPLLTLCALQYEGRLRVAFSGICDYPFRQTAMEDALNESIPLTEKLDKICGMLPSPPINNIAGSGEYRMFVLKNTLQNLCSRFGM